MINSNVQGNVPQPPKLNAVGPKPQCQTDRKFTRLLAVLVTNHFAGSWHRLSAAEPSKDPSAAASSGQLGISCKVLVGAKSAANSQLITSGCMSCAPYPMILARSVELARFSVKKWPLTEADFAE